ncbi:hypothetical protein HJG54_07545 [Leptolyngbya sp. NK1-12]|uniref:SWIM-type domain-containing protein n=1 Tax=Leptolyngbya sp. NK1-12 TaxID=2547451 RepID=A0AA97AFT5_9CYAN|nr:hypothetical protein [Leptolyngbya sp. NK1-12]WNZ22724.1 hypothetical protein HJG54_07545 [Leptolyngbya sp. NK1-12]
MVTSLNLVYSAAAVRRMLATTFPVVRIEKWWKVCLVVFKGRRACFMSRQAFLKHFVEWRKAQARALQVTQQLQAPNKFTVRNETKNYSYIVQATPSGLFCECEDYHNQLQFLSKGCCKHGYSVLSYLGFSSLQHYLAALGSGGYLRSQTG